jgi:C4-dicarboxylate transporter, DctM subunit
VIDIEPPSLDEQTGVRVKHGNFVEYALVVVISLAMIVLPVLEAVLRNARGAGVPGGFEWLRQLTVWVGFLGALGATQAGKHLGMATTNFFREGRRKKAALFFGDVVSAAATFFLAYSAYVFIRSNSVSGEKLPGGIPTAWSQCVVPLTLIGVALRFIWKTPGRWRGRIANVAIVAALIAVFLLLGERASFLFWPLTIATVAAFILGTPVFAAVAALAMLLFWRDGTPLSSVAAAVMQLAENETLPAIPLLTLAGYILASGGASTRMVRAYKSLFGWLPGGIALMVVFVCAAFTTFTGGSGVTILALGGILFPALVKDRYPEGFSLGLVTASGSLGLLFPPCLPVILYGAVAHVAPDKLFLGGLVPGILLMLIVSAYAIRTGIKSGAPRQEFNRKEMFSAMWTAKWDLGLPAVVLVAFVTGKATVVESAAIGAAYALIVELAIFRDVHPVKEMPRVIVQSATLVGAVVILMGVALGLNNYLVDAQIPDRLVDWVQAHFHSQWTFLLALNALLLVLGSVFEIYAAIITLAPLIAPLGAVFNIEPVHLGVVFLANLELGFLFPPMGLNLFLSASRFNRPLPYLYRQALPFLLILAFGVLVITYVPAMTTGVVRLFSH